MWIEHWLEEQNGFWQTHLEFPGGKLKKIDAIVMSRIQDPDLAPSPVYYYRNNDITGEVFEIEPIDKALDGLIEINEKLGMMQSGTLPLSGYLPDSDKWYPPRNDLLSPFEGASYRWTDVKFQLGTKLSTSIGVGPVRIQPGVQDVGNAYWIMLIAPGLIVYEDENSLKEAGIGLSAAAVGVYFTAKYTKVSVPEPVGVVNRDWLLDLCQELGFVQLLPPPFEWSP
jgi:hypothetical protein